MYANVCNETCIGTGIPRRFSYIIVVVALVIVGIGIYERVQWPDREGNRKRRAMHKKKKKKKSLLAAGLRDKGEPTRAHASHLHSARPVPR